jgi:hypothetical protein
MDAGHWQFTDAGWFWQSDYPWGDMAFHYGRWIKSEFTGGRWGWVPGYDWAPSWVSWREGGGGMGWAPLPWGVEFHAGHGLFWHGAEVTAGVDFGLGFDTFVFVGNDHFWGGNYNLYVYDRERSRTFFEHSTFHAGFVMEGGHLRAEGLGRDHMAEITHHEVVVRPVVELRHAEETHNFAKRAEEHKELARVPAHVKEPAHPEANHAAEAHKGAAASEKASAGHAPETHAAAPAKEANGHAATSEKAATTHTPETHSMTPAKEPTTHPAATSEKESTTHASEAHSAAPPSTHPAAKEPAAPARPPAVAPKPPASTANPKPGTPGKGATNSTPRP